MFEHENELKMLVDGIVPAGKSPLGLDIVRKSENARFEQLFFSHTESVIDAGKNSRNGQFAHPGLFDDPVFRRFHVTCIFGKSAGRRFFIDELVKMPFEQGVNVVKGLIVLVRVVHFVQSFVCLHYFNGQKDQPFCFVHVCMPVSGKTYPSCIGLDIMT